MKTVAVALHLNNSIQLHWQKLQEFYEKDP